MNRIKISVCIILLLGFISCRESYEPDVISSNLRYLVVEGTMVSGGATNIIISRSFKLDDTARLEYEPNAIVTVEGEDNSVQPLSFLGNGTYHSPALTLNYGTAYRLRIKTSNGKEYLSDPVIAKETPPIDSVGWHQTAEGLRIYVNTHDPSEGTRYYRWDYDETWEIRSYYYSFFIYSNGIVRERTPAEDVSTCWKHARNTKIIVGSSARLQSDVIFEAPIQYIPDDDEKVSQRYSILVRQYAIDKSAFEFYELMKRNTENVGTVFDPQPSEIWGNIRCISDPSETVIGYVSASSVTEKRIFVNNTELADWNYPQNCPSTDVANHPDSIQAAFESGLSPYDAIYSPVSTAIIGYASSSKRCVECTSRGGSTLRPLFW